MYICAKLCFITLFYNMKQKIKSALEQGYKNLGVCDEAFERVAALGETFIKEESQIADFVTKAEDTLKLYQSEADKIRTKASEEKKALEAKVADLEAKLNGAAPKDEPTNEPEQPSKSPIELAKIVADAVAIAMKPVNEKIEAFESGQATKQAIANAEATFRSNDWVKKYKDEAEDAWERAVEYNELSGNKMTAEQLNEKAMGYFSKAVSRKGEDVSKPFKSDGGGVDDTKAAREIAELLKGNSGK